TTTSHLSTHATAYDSHTHSHPLRYHGETLPSSCLLFFIYFVVLRGPSGDEPTVCIAGPFFIVVGSLLSSLLLHHCTPPLFDCGIDPLHSPCIRRLLAMPCPLAKVLHIPSQIYGAPIFSPTAIPTLFQYFYYFDPPTPPFWRSN
ncbi:hypothetical protein Salat_2575300, partial [Sesamum alatum]